MYRNAMHVMITCILFTINEIDQCISMSCDVAINSCHSSIDRDDDINCGRDTLMTSHHEAWHDMTWHDINNVTDNLVTRYQTSSPTANAKLLTIFGIAIKWYDMILEYPVKLGAIHVSGMDWSWLGWEEEIYGEDGDERMVKEGIVVLWPTSHEWTDRWTWYHPQFTIWQHHITSLKQHITSHHMTRTITNSITIH